MSYVWSLLSENVVSFFIFLLLLLLFRKYAATSRLPPGPWPWPLVGNFFLLTKKDAREVFRKLRAEYGDLFILRVGTRNLLVVNGISRLQELFNHCKDFDNRPPVFTTVKVGQAKGVIFSNNEVWHEHRAFLLSNMKGLGIARTQFQENIKDEIQPLLQKLHAQQGRDYDPCYALQTAMSNIICSISFGQRFKHDDPQLVELLDTFEENMKIVGGLSFVNYFPFLEHLPFDPLKCDLVVSNVAKVQKVIRGWIQQHRQTLDPNKPRDIIDRYLINMDQKQRKSEKTTMDDSQLLKFIGDLFVAGAETTSTTMRWTLIFLVYYPEVQSRILKEIHRTLDSRTQLDIEDRKSMPYTCAAILEAQRLADIAPFSLFHSNRDNVTLGEYVIPKDTLVVPNLNSVHHDPSVWESPLEFRPERFLDDKGNVFNKKECMPFCIGSRMCPGRSLAKMELFLFLTSIVQEFQILPSETSGLPSMQGHLGVTYVPPKHALRFVKRRPCKTQ